VGDDCGCDNMIEWERWDWFDRLSYGNATLGSVDEGVHDA
jgi:hypothetical protein